MDIHAFKRGYNGTENHWFPVPHEQSIIWKMILFTVAKSLFIMRSPDCAEICHECCHTEQNH